MKKKQIVRTYCKKKEDRNVNDKYLTPISIITQFLDLEIFDKDKTFLEPCSDINKNIEKTLKKYKYTNIKSNIFEKEGIDFLQWDENDKYDYIISNTPYKNANDFIIKCMKVCKEKFCLFFPLDYCNGIKRYNKVLNNDLGWKLSKMYVYVRKVMLENEFVDKEGIYYRTGLGCYAWYIYEKNYTGKTTIEWINNNKYALGSKDCKYKIIKKTKKIVKKDKKL
jgi:hypothetical protein